MNSANESATCLQSRLDRSLLDLLSYLLRGQDLLRGKRLSVDLDVPDSDLHLEPVLVVLLHRTVVPTVHQLLWSDRKLHERRRLRFSIERLVSSYDEEPGVWDFLREVHRRWSQRGGLGGAGLNTERSH